MKKRKMKAEFKQMKRCLKAFVAYTPHEVVKDVFAYDRLLQNIKSSAKAGLKKSK